MAKRSQFPQDASGNYTTIDGVLVRTLYVSSLCSEVAEKDLRCAFGRYGTIIDVAVIKKYESHTNFGFVTFLEPAEASSALRMSRKIFVRHRNVKISPADSWHQPIELPGGELILHKDKKKKTLNNDPPEDEGETSCCSNIFQPIIPDESSPISKLNDDCLLLIFNCLSLDLRLDLHEVCQRWESLSKMMWSSVKKLDFTVGPLANFRLTGLKLKQFLSLCPNLTSINIATEYHMHSSNAIITIGNHCHQLEEITMKNVHLGKRSFAFLAKNCPNLREFNIDCCDEDHDGEMFSLVKNAYNLERIRFRYSANVVPIMGRWLQYIKSPLKSLYLEMYFCDPSFVMKGIENVKETLRELALVCCNRFSADDVEKLVMMVPELTHLTLAGGSSDFTVQTLQPILSLTKLTNLNLGTNCYISDVFLEELAHRCNLQSFSLSGVDPCKHLSSGGLSNLRKFTGLTYLNLACVPTITDSTLKSISMKVKALKYLGLILCNSVTDEGCQSIVTNCKELETLDVSGCYSVTDLTLIAAVEAIRETGRKLRIIAGDSGIDLDTEVPPSIILDPSTTSVPTCTNSINMYLVDSDDEYVFMDELSDNETYYEEFDDLYVDMDY